MISLLNFIDTGFIITLGLLLLVSGAIMLYCYRRLNILEDSVIQHGKILQNFIMNHNNQMMSYNQVFGGQSNFNSGGSNNLEKISEENEVEEKEVEENEVEEIENKEEDVEEVEEVLNNLKIVNLEDKIVVSDDESEESDSDSESDNESDNDSEENEESDESDNDENEDNDSENEDNEDKMNEKKNATKAEDDFLNNIPIDLETLNMNVQSKLVNLNLDMDFDLGLDNEKSFAQEKRNFSKMKVDELKSLVVTKNLMDNDNAQKMKKNDLVKLLQE
jgi:hypothetical protein